jgi:hypothetical protein
VTSFLRNWQIMKFTAQMANKRLGLQKYGSAGLLTSTAAIPRQLYPQMAKAISTALDRGSSGWLSGVLGNGNLALGNVRLNSLSTWLAKVHDDSLFAQLQSAGSHKASILEQQNLAHTNLANRIARMTNPTDKAIFTAYQSLLQAVHNAPGFAFAAKHYHTVPLPKLALMTRQLTGDPRTGGQYYIHPKDPLTGQVGKARAIRFESEGVAHAFGLAAKAMGWGVENVGRAATPWFNATMQGMKRIGQAYLNNPVQFTMRAWTYAMLPGAATFMINRYLGVDPNGYSYVDYMMNGRSDYQKTMEYYIGIRGLPVEQGIRIPRFHELAFAARMMESALDHLFRSSRRTESEDFKRALWSILDIAIAPPTPPIMTFTLAKEGFTSPQGMFSGEAYRRRTQPYDSTSGLPANVELIMRSIASGIAEVAGAGAAAYIQTPKGVIQGFENALKEAGTRIVTRTPLVRDVLGMHAPAAGNTPVTEELFKKQKTIEDLNRYYKTWGLTGEKDIKTDWASKKGGALAQEALKQQGDPLGGAPLSPTRAGLGQAEPTNPLYIEAAGLIHAKFKKDAPLSDPKMMPGRDDLIDPRSGKELKQTPGAKNSRERKQKEAEARYQAALDEGGGGMGYRSLWNRYGDASAKLKDLYNINAGNFVTWQERLRKRDPEGLKELTNNNVPLNDHIAIRNFYERVRQVTGRTILHAIHEVEDEMTKKYGRPIKIEDLEPYLKPSDAMAGESALDLSIPGFFQ